MYLQVPLDKIRTYRLRADPVQLVCTSLLDIGDKSFLAMIGKRKRSYLSASFLDANPARSVGPLLIAERPMIFSCSILVVLSAVFSPGGKTCTHPSFNRTC
jgi:hypothetical protein